MCRVDEGELATGDAIRLELPRSWHAGDRNSAKRVQASAPELANHVSARTDQEGAQVVCTVEDESPDEYVKTPRTGIDGRRHRYVFVVRVDVRAGALRRGATIVVTFGAGDAGFVAAFHPEGDEPIRAALLVGDRVEQLDPERCPRVAVSPGPEMELIAVAPSHASPGMPVEVRVLSLDRLANRALGPHGVEVVHIEGPARLVRSSVDGGVTRLSLLPIGEGVIRARVRANGLDAVMTNPVLARHGDRAGLYWGDLHSHAADSFDGVGRTPFAYARDVSCLDFYALTEHAEGWTEGVWDALRSAVAREDQPGQFVTLLGYEATFRPPWGHHNVYLRDLDGPVIDAVRGTLPELWAALAEGRALTVPHHTGICFLRPQVDQPARSIPATVDWSHHHPGLRRLVEIYSAHGQCELFDPSHPLAYEQSDFQFNASAEGPHYVRDAWTLGYRLGTIASSDDHHGQPGRGERGLAAVRAERLSREGIFDALLGRSCYATTGARIIVEFEIDGQPMGQEVRATGPLRLSVRVHGTGPLELVEIVRLGPGVAPTVIARWEPRIADLIASATETHPSQSCLYYVRLRQRGSYRGRPPSAWTTPIWVTVE